MRHEDTPGPQPSITVDGTRVKGSLSQFAALMAALISSTATVVGVGTAFGVNLVNKVDLLQKAHEEDVAARGAQGEEIRALRSDLLEVRVLVRQRLDIGSIDRDPTRRTAP